MRLPGAGPEPVTLVHLMQPINQQGRLARALEQLGARVQAPARAPADPAGSGPLALAKAPPLTERECEILRLS
jgi:hypothetical protein